MITQNARTWLTGRRLPLLVMGLAVALALAASLGGWLATGGTAHAHSASGHDIKILERDDDSMVVRWATDHDRNDPDGTDVCIKFVVAWQPGTTNSNNDAWTPDPNSRITTKTLYAYDTHYRLKITKLEKKGDTQYQVWIYEGDGTTEHAKIFETDSSAGGEFAQQGDKGKVAPPDGDGAQEGEPGRAEPPEADPLTASVVKKPSDHNGKKKFVVRVKFSEPVDAGSANIIAATSVEGGKAVKARKYKGRAAQWNITVKPTSDDDVTIRLSSSQDCTDANAVCTEDDRALSGAVSVTVSGPSDD